MPVCIGRTPTADPTITDPSNLCGRFHLTGSCQETCPRTHALSGETSTFYKAVLPRFKAVLTHFNAHPVTFKKSKN
jgi:hypothetical protein